MICLRLHKFIIYSDYLRNPLAHLSLQGTLFSFLGGITLHLWTLALTLEQKVLNY